MIAAADDELLRTACNDRERCDCAKEAAYQLLHRLDFDVARAVTEWASLPNPVSSKSPSPLLTMRTCKDRVPFSDEERSAFEDGLVTFGKNFFQIQETVPE